MVADDGSVTLVNWRFNAWAKYPNFDHDALVGAAVERITGLPRIEPKRPDNGERVVLEGGAIDTDGEGTLLVTEECLLSPIQERNPGLTRDGYERVFRDALGIRQTIWLGEGCVGDDTHGHVDDIARFTAPGVIVLAYEEDPADDENHRRSVDNFERLQLAGGERGALSIVKLPYPSRRRDERRAAAGELCELLHREWCGDRADVQRSERSRRAEHSRRAVSRPRGRWHSCGRSRLGPRDVALSHPTAAESGTLGCTDLY